MPALPPISQAAAAVVSVDGRTRAGRLLRSIERDLIAHVGGNPNTAQRLVIDQIAQLKLRLAGMDAQIAAGTPMSARARTEYIRWTNALARLLRELGPAAAQRQPTLAEILAQVPASTRRTAAEAEVADEPRLP